MNTDVLIIGSGGAGLSAALSAKQNGAKVLVVGESYPTRSQTSMAQGGINAVLDSSKGDSIQKHIEDTIKASHNLADHEMVKLMCEDAPKVIHWLDSIGVPFSRTNDSKIAQRRLGGTKYPRACYSQDYSGLKILHTLYDNCLKEDIKFLNRYFCLKLIVEDNISKGALFLDMVSGETKLIEAKVTILATGGFAGIFHSNTTNSYSQNGDGISLAVKAGAKVTNLNFIQFHPTGLKNSSVLISESARGAGGKLLNSKGERFVDELLPRDKVSEAIWKQIENGEEVFLDITHLGEEFITENLPQERKLAIFYEGIDPVKDPVPVKPVAHYSMGGIEVNRDLQTSVKNLFAVGECSDAKVHGANRLGGNSLLEIVSFGLRAGKNASKTDTYHDIKEKHDFDLDTVLDTEPKVNFYQKQKELGSSLYMLGGVIKTKENLNKLLKYIDELENSLCDMGVFDKSKTLNTNLVDFLKFKNTLFIAKEYAKSSLEALS